MANFYYNQNGGGWYSDDQYTTAVDITTIASGDGIYGNYSNLLNGVDLSDLDLRGVNFFGYVVGWGGIDFSGSNLSGVTLSAVFYSDLGLSSSNFSGANLADASLPSFASGYYGNRYFINGVETPLSESGTGWYSNSGVYYIGGVATTLDSNGSGFWSDKAYLNVSEQPTGWNGYFYYIDNVETTLDSDGTGFWNDVPYVVGYVWTQGWLPLNNIYYINGQATTLFSNGDGQWNGSWYINGQIPDPTFTGCGYGGGTYGYFHNGNYLGGDVNCDGTGYDNQYYYAYVINGQPTELDQLGNGYWNGTLYGYGSTHTGPVYGNWNTFQVYFINGQLTELDESGNGTYNGQTYVNGVVQGGGGGSVNLEDGLQAFYKLSDLSDSSGNGRTLINNGNVSFASGKIGNAAVFDGTNYLNNGVNIQPFINDDWTITCWVKADPNNIGSYAPIFADEANNLALQFQDTIYFQTMWANSFIASNVALDNTWQFVTVKRQNGTVYLYLNSTLEGSGVMEMPQNGTDFRIANNGDANSNLIGSVDAVGIWNRALSDAEVAALYNNGTGLELPAGPAVKNGWIDNIFWINDVATTLDQNGDGTWQGKLYENGSLFSGSKYSLTFVDGLAQPENIVTVIGNDIPVAFGLNEAEEPLVELVFASITSAGETVIEQIIPTVLPTGYTVAETVLAYSIDTTATFEGSINVDFILPSNISQTVFDRVKGFHVKNSGSIEEMTRISSDFSTKRITVTITSFSDFLFLDEPPQTGGKFVKIQGKSKFYGKVKFGV